MRMVKEVRTNRDMQGELGSRSLRVKRHTQSGEDFHLHGDTEEKRIQRQRIAKHFANHYPTDNAAMRLFTFPGQYWTFERELIATYGDRFRFIACENNVVTWEKSAGWMPGRNKILRQWWIEELDGHVDAWITKRATLICSDAWRLLSGHMTPSHWEKKTAWNSKFQRHDGIWIDSFSPLGSHSYGHILRGVSRIAINRNIACAFSFLLGRDDASVSRLIDICPGNTPLDRRAAYIKLVIEAAGVSFEISDTFAYRSFNHQGSVHLGTVMGIAKSLI